MAKLKEVRFARFDLGLPGNLTPVAAKDYRDLRAQFGGGTKADGWDGLRALQERRGDRLLRLFRASRRCTIWAGRRKPTEFCCPSGGVRAQRFRGPEPATNRSKDWKSWDGRPFGQGYLADNYYALLAVSTATEAVRVPAARGR